MVLRRVTVPSRSCLHVSYSRVNSYRNHNINFDNHTENIIIDILKWYRGLPCSTPLLISTSCTGRLGTKDLQLERASERASLGLPVLPDPALGQTRGSYLCHSQPTAASQSTIATSYPRVSITSFEEMQSFPVNSLFFLIRTEATVIASFRGGRLNFCTTGKPLQPLLGPQAAADLHSRMFAHHPTKC